MQNSIKLQLALDVGSLGKALEMLEQVHPFVDIIELGTPLIVSEGLRAVEKIKQLFPHQACLADLKIMDGGCDICMAAFKRGADIVTVLSLADDETIRLALKAALNWDKKIMVDLINEKDLISRGKSLEAMGVSILCVHTPHDRQDDPAYLFHDLRKLRENSDCTLAIAGGIKLDHVQDAMKAGADILIVGGEITASDSPHQSAQVISERIRVIN